MGGYNAGEVASGIAVAMLTTEMKQALQSHEPHRLAASGG
jgi:serine/threonine protein phosphatase PrpC